jgi:hypothetical protein
MTDFANDLEEALIDWAFGGSAFPSVPSDIYVALHTGAPGDDAQANEIPTTEGYSRQALANPGDWTKTNHDQAENTAVARFGPATADWGDVSHASLWTAETGGLALWAGDLSEARTVLQDDEYELPAGEITAGAD